MGGGSSGVLGVKPQRAGSGIRELRSSPTDGRRTVGDGRSRRRSSRIGIEPQFAASFVTEDPFKGHEMSPCEASLPRYANLR